MIKILFNGLSIRGNLSGVQNYALGIMSKGLMNVSDCKFTAIIYKNLVQQNINLMTGNEMKTIGLNSRSRLQRIIWEHCKIDHIYKQTKSDILHCPAYILPWKFKGLSVVTVHDIIALESPSFCKTSNASYFKFMLPHSIKNASAIITPSKKVKGDILQKFDIDERKISVVGHGIDDIFFRQFDPELLRKIRTKYNLPDKYLLFVGNIEPKKNLTNVAKALGILSKSKRLDFKLVIVGQKGWKYNSFFTTIRELGLENLIMIIGYVPKDELALIYKMAELFVFPSLYEGFGIPPLEAMAAGVPVLASRQGALPEITSGFCAYAEAQNAEDISDKIISCLSDYNWRNKSVVAGKQHAAQFTWDKAWRQTLNIYESII